MNSNNIEDFNTDKEVGPIRNEERYSETRALSNNSYYYSLFSGFQKTDNYKSSFEEIKYNKIKNDNDIINLGEEIIDDTPISIRHDRAPVNYKTTNQYLRKGKITHPEANIIINYLDKIKKNLLNNIDILNSKKTPKKILNKTNSEIIKKTQKLTKIRNNKTYDYLLNKINEKLLYVYLNASLKILNSKNKLKEPEIKLKKEIIDLKNELKNKAIARSSQQQKKQQLNNNLKLESSPQPPKQLNNNLKIESKPQYSVFNLFGINIFGNRPNDQSSPKQQKINVNKPKKLKINKPIIQSSPKKLQINKPIIQSSPKKQNINKPIVLLPEKIKKPTIFNQIFGDENIEIETDLIRSIKDMNSNQINLILSFKRNIKENNDPLLRKYTIENINFIRLLNLKIINDIKKKNYDVYNILKNIEYENREQIKLISNKIKVRLYNKLNTDFIKLTDNDKAIMNEYPKTLLNIIKKINPVVIYYINKLFPTLNIKKIISKIDDNYKDQIIDTDIKSLSKIKSLCKIKELLTDNDLQFLGGFTEMFVDIVCSTPIGVLKIMKDENNLTQIVKTLSPVTKNIIQKLEEQEIVKIKEISNLPKNLLTENQTKFINNYSNDVLDTVKALPTKILNDLVVYKKSNDNKEISKNIIKNIVTNQNINEVKSIDTDNHIFKEINKYIKKNPPINLV
jgi:hypothetical protein